MFYLKDLAGRASAYVSDTLCITGGDQLRLVLWVVKEFANVVESVG